MAENNDKSLQNIANLQAIKLPTFDNTHYRTLTQRPIFTYGHSTRSIDDFIARLIEYRIDRLVDVRTKPYSRRYPHFNREDLAVSLAEHDINYDFRGNNLGGLGENILYHETLQELYKLASTENIALCCSEMDYKKCHRYTLLAPDLSRLGATIVHITNES